MKIASAFAALAAGVVLFALPTKAAVLFSEDFSGNSAGWSLGPEWQIGSATASSGQNNGGPDPAIDHTPTTDNGVAGVNIGGNATTTLHPSFYYLSSPAVDTLGKVGAITFEFYRWLNSDYSPFMQNVVEVFDGLTWQTIWSTGSYPGIQDSSWVLQTFDVTAYRNGAFQVRFGFNITTSPGVYTVSSWNVDDVRIYDEAGTTPLPAALPLFATGLGALGLLGWRRKRKQAAVSVSCGEASFRSFRPFFLLLIVPLLMALNVGGAWATSLNIDFGSTRGVPLSSFGASANQAGTWNAITTSVPVGLAGLGGGPSGASLSVSGTGFNFLGAAAFAA